MDSVQIYIVVSFLVGLIAAACYAYKIISIKLDGQSDSESTLIGSPTVVPVERMKEIAGYIERGATAFLIAEYRIVAAFMVVFALLIGFTLPNNSIATALAFIWGGSTSLLCGFIGMRVAVKANVRVTHEATKGFGPAFLTAFEGGAVMGFALVSLGLMNLYFLILVMERVITSSSREMFEAVAGYGLGGSTVALFGRVGGGIYTKAADVGADLVGKVEAGIPEDDPRNPATIADNVGDNVGDIAGMGADLFGSFAEATCAALVISARSKIVGSNNMLGDDDTAKWFPLVITATGIFSCLVTSMVTQVWRVKKEADIENQLKLQLIISTVLTTPLIYLVAVAFLPPAFIVTNVATSSVKIFCCIAVGLWSGLLIGLVTEYYTSHSYEPVRTVAKACNEGGAATNIIFGLALGYQSCVVPVFALALTIWTGFALASTYGIAMAALGMLSTLCIGLTIDAYGPISDNAGGIAEMSMPESDNNDGTSKVRERTDALDAAGNTTAAIGKGFAIGSAALVSLALFGAFTVRADICKADTGCDVNVLSPLVFSGLMIGAMIPYWFSAMTMKSVGLAAQEMVEEVRRQFREHPGIMNGTEQPEYERCVAVSTTASLKEMIWPGLLVVLSPLVVGFLFGKYCLAGFLAGSLVSGVQVAISMSNTGGAWDNAKKYIEKGNYGGKRSDPHKAAVIGDTVGDPMKDTSGPSVNIVMKLMAIISLVFAGATNRYGGLVLRLTGIQ